MDDAGWFQLTVKAREVEIKDRQQNFDRARPPLLVGVDQRIVRWSLDRIEALEEAVRELQARGPKDGKVQKSTQGGDPQLSGLLGPSTGPTK